MENEEVESQRRSPRYKTVIWYVVAVWATSALVAGLAPGLGLPTVLIMWALTGGGVGFWAGFEWEATEPDIRRGVRVILIVIGLLCAREHVHAGLGRFIVGAAVVSAVILVPFWLGRVLAQRRRAAGSANSRHS